MIALLVLLLIALILWYVLRRDKLDIGNTIELDKFDMDSIINKTKKAHNQVLRARPEDLNLDKRQLDKIMQNKSKFRKALREASIGDEGAKSYVKDMTFDVLEKKIGINAVNIDSVIPFTNPAALSKEERFEILLYCYKKKKGYGEKALNELFSEYHLDELREDDSYVVTEEDIKYIYNLEVKELTYDDKLAILCQRVFELAYGNNVIDDYFKKVDGISGGVSGMPSDMIDYFEDGTINNNSLIYSYDSIWLLYKGKPVRMACIGFGSEKELIRVSRNMQKYNTLKPMTQNNPHIEGEMKDGSRSVGTRKPFTETWSFSVRHHGDVVEKKIENILTDTNCELAIELMEFLVKGNRTFLITGTKGSGKTTLLRSVVAFIRNTYRIQVQESISELWLRKVFPEKFIMTFKDSPIVSGEEALEIGRKWESEVSLLGEIVSYKVASWLIQMKQVASLMVAGTHHANTTRSLIMWFRDARMTGDNALSSEKYAEQEVVECINFDVHMAIDTLTGHRYIERITEIVPVITRGQFEDNYRLVNILEYDEDAKSYKLAGEFSDESIKDIRRNLNKVERARFDILLQKMKRGDNNA